MPLRITLGRTGQSWEAALQADPAAEVTGAQTLVDLLVAAQMHTPDVIVVAEDFPRLAEGLAQLRRLGRVVVVGDGVLADCRPAEVSAGTLARSQPVPGDRGTLVAVWGPQGSWGVTSLAVGLAAGLSSKGRTLLVDANVHASDVAEVLDVPAGGLLQACLAADRGTVDLPTHPSGPIDVLTGVEPAMYPSVHAAALQQVLRQAASGHDWVVVDTDSAVDAAGELGLVPDWTTATAVTLQEADHLVVVVGESDLARRRLWRALPAVAELTTAAATVVVNRCREPKAATADIAARLGDFLPGAAVGWITDRITPASLRAIVADVAAAQPAVAG